MMKLISFLSRLIGLAVLLAAGAIAAVANLMDPSEYKSEISALVDRHFERDLDLRGDLDITFFPWLGVRAERIALSEHADFGGRTMFTADHVSFRVKLLPLLRKRFEIDRIALAGPRLSLRRRADGSANWDDLIAAFGLKNKRAPAAAGLAGLAVLGISVDDGSFAWQDRSGGMFNDFIVDALQVRADSLTPGAPSPIIMSARLPGWQPQPAVLTLKTSAFISRDLKTAALHDTELRAEGADDYGGVLSIAAISYSRPDGRGEFEGISATHLRGEASAQLRAETLSFDLAEGSFNLPKFELAQGDFETRGAIYGAQLGAAPQLSARMRVRAGDVADLFSRYGVAFKPPVRIDDFDGGFDLRLGDGRLGVEFLTADLTLNHHPSKLTASGFNIDLAALFDGAAPPEDNAVSFGKFTLTQDDFFLRASGALPARGEVEARSDDIEGWLARNALDVKLPRGLSGVVGINCRFEYASGWLAVHEMKGESEGGLGWNIPYAEIPADNFESVIATILQAPPR